MPNIKDYINKYRYRSEIYSTLHGNGSGHCLSLRSMFTFKPVLRFQSPNSIDFKSSQYEQGVLPDLLFLGIYNPCL